MGTTSTYVKTMRTDRTMLVDKNRVVSSFTMTSEVTQPLTRLEAVVLWHVYHNPGADVESIMDDLDIDGADTLDAVMNLRRRGLVAGL